MSAFARKHLQTISVDSSPAIHNEIEKPHHGSTLSSANVLIEESNNKYEKIFCDINEVINGAQVNSDSNSLLAYEPQIFLTFQVTPGVNFSVILKWEQEPYKKIEIKTKKSERRDEFDQTIRIPVRDNNNKAVNLNVIIRATSSGSAGSRKTGGRRKTWEIETVSGQCDEGKESSKRDSDCFEAAWESFTESGFSVILSSANEFEGEEEHNFIAITTFEALNETTNDFDMASVQNGGCRLGSGSFGDVFLGRLSLCDMERDVAIKRFKPPKEEDKPSRKDLHRKQFSTEITSMIRIRHPNIAQLLALSVDGPQPCLVYEYVSGGTLKAALAKDSRNPPSVQRRLGISQDIARALHYLHSLSPGPGVLHRDVKSANVLLEKGGNAKLTDFGLATFMEEDLGSKYFLASVSVGTRSYMSPEALRGRVSPKTDVYAFGVVLFEIVTGLPSYSAAKKIDLVNYVLQLEKEGNDTSSLFDPRIGWSYKLAYEYGLIRLAKRCTEKDQNNRPRMDEVLNVLGSLKSARET